MQSFSSPTGTSLHYRHRKVDPEAPTLLFINSLGTDLRVWDALQQELPKAWNTLHYDKPGHGLSDFNPGLDIAGQAKLVIELLDHCDISTASVVGLSVGGLIAQSLASTHPSRIEALVLMDTAHRIGHEALWNQRIEAIREQGIAAISEGILERWFTKRFRDCDPGFPAWRNMLERTPAEGYIATCEAIRDADFTSQSATLVLPTLCLCGSEDGSTPPALVRELSDLISHSQFVQIDEAGHLPGVEQPLTTARLITDFILSNHGSGT